MENLAKNQFLMSDPIRCQSSDGQIQFKYWTTKDTTLEVCILDEEGSVKNCEKPSDPSPGPVQMKIPASETPFRIAFRADNSKSGFVAVDEVFYEAEICRATTTSTTTTTVATTTTTVAPTTTTTVGPKPNVAKACTELKCNFEGGSCVGYPNSTGWFRSKERIGPALNQRIGTNDGDYYLASPVIEYKQEAVLESGEFPPLEEDVQYTFSYSRGTYGSQLFLCTQNKTNDCQRISQPALTLEETKQFQSRTMVVPKGTTKLVFRFTHEDATSGKAQAGLDVFNLNDIATGLPIC